MKIILTIALTASVIYFVWLKTMDGDVGVDNQSKEPQNSELILNNDDIDSQERVDGVVQLATSTDSDVIAKWYAPLYQMKVADEVVLVSLADTVAKRTKGLSDTPYLPKNVVKLFVFDEVAVYGFWMKDMLYPIDIIWVNEAKEIIHIEPNVQPESYPKNFGPSEPAKYVVETVAGFTAEKGIIKGDYIVLPEGIE